MEELGSLLGRAQNGDLDAYGELVTRFQDMAVGYAYSLLGDFHLAQDAAQEAFVEAYLHLSRVYGAAAFPAWLRKVVFKHCDRIRRRQRDALVSLEAAGQVAASGEDPATAVEARETRRQIHAALQALPVPEREAATLFYIASYSHKQIAAFLGLPATTVNNCLHSARQRLKKEFLNMAKEDLHTHRPSRDETFVNQVLQPIMSSEELLALEKLHDQLVVQLSETFSAIAGKEAQVTVGYVDQTTYAEVVSALAYYPTGTYWFTMAPLPGQCFLNMAAPTFFALMGDAVEDVRRLTTEEADRLWAQDTVLAHRARALRQLTAEQIEAFHPEALKILEALERAWASQRITLKQVEVTSNGPALRWTADGGLAPGGCAAPNTVVAIVGLDVGIAGYDSDDLNTGGPRLHYPAIMLCYPLDVFAGIRPLARLV